MMSLAPLVLAAALHLEPCEVPGATAKARCGTLAVWENREAGAGRRIPIKVVVFPAVATQSTADPLFVLAGGPGQSATEFAGMLLRDFAFVHATRDVVFVDQRGTGGSNALHCTLGGTFGELVQSIAIGVDADVAAVERCRQELERIADLRMYTTPLAVADLEDVRAALGYERINLFAASYGTRVALVYMRDHPQRVRSAILRGLVPIDMPLPETVVPDSERALHRLLAACDADPRCRKAYPLAEDSLRTLLSQLKNQPVEISVTDPRTGNREVVRVDDQVFGTTIYFLLFVTDWAKDIPRMVHSAVRGDYVPFAEALPRVVLTATPVHWGMRRSVLCSEDVALASEARVRDLSHRSVIADESNLGLLAACRLWPTRPLPPEYFEPVVSNIPVLAISGVEDPVLPPHRSERALRTLSNALHVIVPGTAHGPNFPGCVRHLAADFLDHASSRALDTRCVGTITRPPFTITSER